MPKPGCQYGNYRVISFLICCCCCETLVCGSGIPLAFPLQWHGIIPLSCEKPEKSPWMHASWQAKCQGSLRANASVWGYFGKQLLPHMLTTCCTPLSRSLPGKEMGIEDDFRNRITSLWRTELVFPFISALVTQHWGKQHYKVRLSFSHSSLGMFARGKQVLLRGAPQKSYLFMQNCSDMMYQLATDPILTFDERLLCCICVPDSSTMLQGKAKAVVCSRGWITPSHMLVNVTETCSCYGYGHANLHLAGASSYVQLITLNWSSFSGQSGSKVTLWKVLLTQKDICLQLNCLEGI